MRILAIIGIVLALFIGLPLLASLFISSQVHVERTAEINAPPEVVFQQVNNLRNWEEWSPWHQIDSNMQLEYTGSGEGTGSSYIWTSEHQDVGNGSLIITKSEPYERIETEMNFMDQGTAYSDWLFEKTDSGTRVTWSMDSDMGNNPVGKYMGLLMDSWLGGDFEEGLSKLKEISEATPPEPELIVTVKEVAPQWVITTRKTMPTIPDSMTANFTRMYQKVGTYMGQNDLAATGPALSINYKWEPPVADIAAGMPVADSIELADTTLRLVKLEGKAAYVVHNGPYDNLETTYTSLMKWMQENEMQPAGNSWEVYQVGPDSEQDPEKWITEIYFPVQ
ncbi:MAG: SRPBCC family protein [Bacteroidia bacterium]